VVKDHGKVHLTQSPGRVDPTNEAWTDSRKPLAGEFVFQGRTVFIIANHFNSKGGDQPTHGRYQPPTRSSEVQRQKQATVLQLPAKPANEAEEKAQTRTAYVG